MQATETTLKYKVKDISLAEWGRKEIELAEAEMPVPEYPAHKELLAGARGASCEKIRLHSLRLPGVVAQQTVYFGGLGQTLRIEHNSLNRESFMPGVCLACKRVRQIQTLVYGLENLL